MKSSQQSLTNAKLIPLYVVFTGRASPFTYTYAGEFGNPDIELLQVHTWALNSGTATMAQTSVGRDILPSRQRYNGRVTTAVRR